MNKLTPTLSLMQESDNASANVFAPAYIRPKLDGGGDTGNNTSTVSFLRNIPGRKQPVNMQLNRGRGSGGNDGPDFWVVYLQIAYQGGEKVDNDPKTEDTEGGITTFTGKAVDAVTNDDDVPPGGEGSLVYLEASRDGDLQTGNDFLQRVAPHEIGHQFGIKGDGPAVQGLMSIKLGSALTFSEAHLNVLRWRVNSPGQ